MKHWKLLAAAGVLGCAVMFGGCGSKTAETTAAETTAAETEAAPQAPEAPAERPENYGTIEIGQYIGLPLEVQEVSVSDEEVDNYLEGLVSANPKTVEVDRPAELGDTVNIDFKGTKDGVAFDGGTGTNYDLKLGSGTFIPGFEDGLVGVKTGETVTLDLTFPENYQAPELSGQLTQFEVTVNAIKVSEPAELSDEWINEFTHGAQTTVDEYKTALHEVLVKQKERGEHTIEQNQLLQTAIDNSTFEVTPEAAAYETSLAYRAFEATLNNYGMNVEGYMLTSGLSAQDIDNRMKESGETAAKLRLLVMKIAEDEGIEAGDAEYTEISEYYGYTLEKLLESAPKDAVEYEALYRAVANFLIEKADKVVVEAKPVEEMIEEDAEAEESEAEETEAAAGETKAQ